MTDFNLLIDDVRIIEEADMNIIARNASDGRNALRDNPVTHLWLDNDLGPNQDMDGYQILQWAIENDCLPPNIILVTANPVRRRNMELALQNDVGYVRDSAWWRKC